MRCRIINIQWWVINFGIKLCNNVTEDHELDSNVMDPQQFERFLSNPREISETDFIPNRVCQNFIELGGWKFNVSRTIFEGGSVDDVIEGWKRLSDVVSMDLLSLVFFLRTVYENLKLGLTYEKGYETDLLELLRLCHWYYRCSKVEKIDLSYKQSELHEQLGGDLCTRAKKYLFKEPNRTTHEFLMDPNALSIIISTKLSTELYGITNDFREKVSSYNSEFIIAALAAAYNFRVRFNKKADGKNNFDIFIEEIPCEVETILDQIPWANKPEPELKKEILDSLKRNKMIEKIVGGLKQGGKIIIINSTVSSLSWGINIDASSSKVSYPLERSLKFAVHNVMHSPQTSIAVVVFGTSIDYDRNYRLSSFFVSYPNHDANNINATRLSFEHVRL